MSLRRAQARALWGQCRWLRRISSRRPLPHALPHALPHPHPLSLSLPHPLPPGGVVQAFRLDWANLLLRWNSIILGVTWIGAPFVGAALNKSPTGAGALTHFGLAARQATHVTCSKAAVGPGPVSRQSGAASDLGPWCPGPVAAFPGQTSTRTATTTGLVAITAPLKYQEPERCRRD